MTRLCSRLCVLTALFFGACGGAGAKIEAAPPAPREPAVVEAATPNPRVGEVPGAIVRKELDAVLAGGPGRLLGWVTTEPYRSNGRFVGFRIAMFVRGAPHKIDLRVGDVILAVNDRQIERPEHLFEVFETLATADELVFELLRDGERVERRYPIVD